MGARVHVLFSADAVEQRLDELAERLYRDYADSPLTLLCIAEGGVRFAEALAERLRARNVQPELRTVRARRTDGTELGAVQVEAFDPGELDERDVLVVDDVVDGGATLTAVLDLLALGEPRSVKTAVLVRKKERDARVPLDHVAFEVERGWVVGFGMDLRGELRDLDEIGIVEETD